METLGDLLARDRRSDTPAVRVDGDRPVEYTYADFVTTAWKTANFFSLRGVHRGAKVGIVDAPAVPSLLSLFGAAQVGAVARFGPPTESDVKLLVGPGDTVSDYDLPPGATRVAYHDVPDEPSVEAFGRSVWSENPTEPPETVSPEETVLLVGDRLVSHEQVLDVAGPLTEHLTGSDEVVIRAPLAEEWTVVAGVIAPLWVGATVVFPDEETTGDVAIGTGDVPEQDVFTPPGTV